MVQALHIGFNSLFRHLAHKTLKGFIKVLDKYLLSAIIVSVKEIKLMAKPKQNENRVSTYLSNEHLEKLKTESLKTGDSVSSLIRRIVIEWLNSKG